MPSSSPAPCSRRSAPRGVGGSHVAPARCSSATPQPRRPCRARRRARRRPRASRAPSARARASCGSARGRTVAAAIAGCAGGRACGSPRPTTSPARVHPGRPRQRRCAGRLAAVQWNFDPGTGVDAPLAWDHLVAGRPARRPGRGRRGARHGRRLSRRPAASSARPTSRPQQFVPGYDFVDGDRFPDDENGHGTHVASTIAEEVDNGIGVTGLAYGAKIMPVRVLDALGEGDIPTIAAGHPLRRPPRRTVHQPLVRVRPRADSARHPGDPQRGALRRPPRRAHRRGGGQLGRDLARVPRARPRRVLRRRGDGARLQGALLERRRGARHRRARRRARRRHCPATRTAGPARRRAATSAR